MTSFRPRLPLDPFTAIDHVIPWSIPQTIPPSHPQTILILGGPTIHDLVSLLTSTHISHSLVLFVTDTPPVVPVNTRGPALRILRLLKPLAAHDAGALRLVSLCERAQRVAHLWPRDSSPHTIQLAQPSPNDDFSIIETVSYAQPTEKSTNELGRCPSPAPSQSVSSPKWRSSLSINKNSHPKSSQKTSNHKKVDYKPFDAIINFLPHGVPDKALLKHAILVTTLSSHFLASPTYIPTAPQTDSTTCISTKRLSLSSPLNSYSSASSSSSGTTLDTSPSPSPRPRRLSKLVTSTTRTKNRLSLLFQAAVPPPPPPPEASSVEESWTVKNAHLVHVLPLSWSRDSGAESDRSDRRASLTLAGPSRSAVNGYIKTPNRGRTGVTCKPKLVQSIEQFLLSFAYPLDQFGLDSGSGAGLSKDLKKRPKSALTLPVSSASNICEKEHASPRASILITPSPSMSNLTNINKPVPYLLAPAVFASCATGGRSNVRSRCFSLPEDVLEQNLTRGAYMDTHTDPKTTALTIGEIILLGALDFDHTRPGTGPANGRAWIGDVGDVVVAGGSPFPGLSSRKVGKTREAAATDSEMMKTTKRNFNGLPTPSESLSRTENVEEEEGGINRTEQTQIYGRPLPSISIPPPPTPVSTIPKSDENSNIFSESLPPLPLPSRSPVEPPPLVVHCDEALSLHESGENCDLGLEHGVLPVPPKAVSIKPGSQSGMGTAFKLVPCKSEDGKTRSPTKGSSERKGFVVRTLRKIGLWSR